MKLMTNGKPVCNNTKKNCRYRVQNGPQKGLCDYKPYIDVTQRNGACDQYFPKFYKGD